MQKHLWEIVCVMNRRYLLVKSVYTIPPVINVAVTQSPADQRDFKGGNSRRGPLCVSVQ